MAKPRIMHMLTPTENVSPFDVNMAADAGFEVVVPYPGIGSDRAAALVQDAIFSRPPKSFKHTGVFIGGHDINVAADMLIAAQKAMVPPFEVGVFADPNGAYTTSAALVALVEHHLRARTGKGLAGRAVAIYGGGPVGLCTAVLVAQQGGKPTLVRLTEVSAQRQAAVEQFAARYDVSLPGVPGQSDEDRVASLAEAEVAITAAKAGIQVLSKAQLREGRKLLVAADVNAVPPAGVEGLEAGDNGVELDAPKGCLGVGALAIGGIKYKVQHGLFQAMLQSDKAVVLDFPDAYRLALELVSG